ncbi:MAG: DUF1064 domain-containing protein [Zoogloeaceae bacterium]|jgi:hypothetical protein|nr:DUF1064 domain-containing protein [Zoogloeaceae bacterium]
MKKWSEQEIAFLRDNYPQKGKAFCAEALGRGEASVRWMASMLALKLDSSSEFFKEFQQRAAQSKVGKKRPEQALVIKRLHEAGKLIKTPEQCAAMSVRAKEWHRTHEHPKGFLGHTHSGDARAKISMSSLRWWGHMSDEEVSARSLKMMKTKWQAGCYATPRTKVTWVGGKRNIGGQDVYFRSKWEANYARYLEFLSVNGAIRAWEYEPDVFWFEGVKRGCVSYLPDFRVEENDGTIIYHEVKGWMDARSKTKLNRMAKYYPNIPVIIIGHRQYAEIKRKVSKLIEGWEP